METPKKSNESKKTNKVMEKIIKFSNYIFKTNEGNQPGYDVDELKKNTATGLGTAKKVDAVSTPVTEKPSNVVKGKELNNLLSNVTVGFGKAKTDLVQDTNNEVLGNAANTPVKTFDNFFKETPNEKGTRVKGKEENLL